MNLAFDSSHFPVRISLGRPVSDGDLLRFSSENKGMRIERDKTGEIVVMTPTGNRTGMKSLYIGRMLGNWAETDGRGYAFDSNTGFSLPDGSMLSPDASWVECKRWDAMTEAQKDEYSPICPEFMIELRSPSDRLAPLQEKMRAWISNGAELAWLVDPSRKTVEIYRPGKDAEEQVGQSAVYGEGPVGGFVLELGKVWGR
jgi:Uma2 family endonuclease